MAVAFNFPDNNELQVQKEVDLTNVTDDDFKNCFKNQKIFNFTIKNQATHYGKKDAVGPDESGTPSKVVDLTAKENKIEPATKPTESNEGDYIFELVPNPWPDTVQDTKKVLHWYARYMDTEPVSAARDKRRGILTLKEPINIEKMRFLTFQVYVDSMMVVEVTFPSTTCIWNCWMRKTSKKAALAHQALTAQRMARSK